LSGRNFSPVLFCAQKPSITATVQIAVWMILPALPVANIDPAQILPRKARELDSPARVAGVNA